MELRFDDKDLEDRDLDERCLDWREELFDFFLVYLIIRYLKKIIQFSWLKVIIPVTIFLCFWMFLEVPGYFIKTLGSDRKL